MFEGQHNCHTLWHPLYCKETILKDKIKIKRELITQVKFGSHWLWELFLQILQDWALLQLYRCRNSTHLPIGLAAAPNELIGGWGIVLIVQPFNDILHVLNQSKEKRSRTWFSVLLAIKIMSCIRLSIDSPGASFTVPSSPHFPPFQNFPHLSPSVFWWQHSPRMQFITLPSTAAIHHFSICNIGKHSLTQSHTQVNRISCGLLTPGGWIGK